MTVDEAASNFQLVDRTCGDQWVHGWAGGDDEWWAYYLERHQAFNRMAVRVVRATFA